MESKDENKNDKSFNSFGRRVDQFMEELNEAGDRLHREFDEKFEELKVAAEKLKKEAESKERWKEVEVNLKKAADELNSAFKAAFRRREH